MDNLTEKKPRIESIDLLRGLVMIVMALDHTRDFFHSQAWSADPLNLQTTTPWLFLTRWITHFCAPVFVFLAGTSAYLQGMRKSKSELSSFLIKRGFWLILVEIVIFNFAFSFDIAYNVIALQTIWSIGISMVFLGIFIRFPFAVVLTTGLLIVFGHNLLDIYESNHTGNFSLWYSLLHHQNMFPLWGNHQLLIFYPFLSWTGLMFLGYCFGRLLYNTELPKRKAMLLKLGSAIILLFIALRAVDTYGEPVHWSVQKNTLYSILSFINTRKYPPSLLYMCMTIGPALLFLAIFGEARNRLTRIISVYGRVPFFYYILHFYLIHALSSINFLIRHHNIAEGVNKTDGAPNFIIANEGYPLWIVYLIWVGIVIALYPLCKWYDGYKTRHREKWWLSYL